MENNSKLFDEIQELIKMDGELESTLKSQLEILEKWRKIDLSLLKSNWSSTDVLQNITEKNEYLSEKVTELIKTYEEYDEKLKFMKSKKSKLAQQTWQRFVEDSQHYQNLIKSARDEYKSENLISDIHHYSVVLEELNNQQHNISRDIEEQTSQLESNIKVKDLEEIKSFVDSLKEDQLPISNIIQNLERERNSVIKKIQQTENDIQNLISTMK